MDYDRRVGHHLTGYFAHNHIPYVTFANLKHTDVYDLIGDNLDITMQKHWHYMQVSHVLWIPTGWQEHVQAYFFYFILCTIGTKMYFYFLSQALNK